MFLKSNYHFFIIFINFAMFTKKHYESKCNTMKRFPLFVLFITMVLLAQANPVGVNQARAIGARFLYANLAMKADNPSELQLVPTYRTENDNAAFYIFS